MAVYSAKPRSVITKADLVKQHPLRPGLSFAYFFGSTLENLVGGLLTAVGSKVLYTDATQEGRALQLNPGGFTDASYVDWTSENAPFAVGSGEDFTVAVRYATTADYGPLLAFRSSGSVNPQLCLYHGSDNIGGVGGTNGQYLVVFKDDAGATTSYNDQYQTASVKDGKPHTLAMRRSAGVIQLSIDGGIWTNVAQGSSNTGAFTPTLNRMAIGTDKRWVLDDGVSATFDYFQGQIFGAWGWHRALRNSDIQRLHRDPYGLIRVKEARRPRRAKLEALVGGDTLATTAATADADYGVRVTQSMYSDYDGSSSGGGSLKIGARCSSQNDLASGYRFHIEPNDDSGQIDIYGYIGSTLVLTASVGDGLYVNVVDWWIEVTGGSNGSPVVARLYGDMSLLAEIDDAAGTYTSVGYETTVSYIGGDGSSGSYSNKKIYGYAGAVSANVTPSAGHVVLTGHAPTVTQAGSGTTVAPSTGHVTLTGYTPVIVQPHAVAPSAGHLVLTGYVPTIVQPHAVAPSTGHVVLAGHAPTVNQTHSAAPSTGHVVLTGYVPTVTQASGNQSVAPSTGHLALTGYTATIVQPHTVAAAVGHIVLTGHQPTVSHTANQVITPLKGALTLTGYQPTVNQAHSAAPSTGHITLTGYQPTVSQGASQNVTPSTGHIALGGHAPTVSKSNNQLVTPGTGHIVLGGKQITVNRTQSAAPITGHAVLTGYQPSISQGAGQAVNPGSGHATLSGKQASIARSNNGIVTPGVGHVSLGGKVPAIVRTANQSVSAGSGHLFLHGYAPSSSGVKPPIINDSVNFTTIIQDVVGY